MQQNVQAPSAPPGFSAISPSYAVVHNAPFQAEVQTQQSFVSVPQGSCGFTDWQSPQNQFNGFDAGRKNNIFFNNGPQRFNNGGNRNFGGFNNMGNNGGTNNARNNTVTCQICNRPGHGARTCRSLLMQGGNNSNFRNNEGCIYCGKSNHSVERCYYLIGFPDQQQQESNNNEPTAMLAAANNAPQFWLADTGATNHMTSSSQALSNVTPYSATDSVQIGNGS